MSGGLSEISVLIIAVSVPARQSEKKNCMQFCVLCLFQLRVTTFALLRNLIFTQSPTLIDEKRRQIKVAEQFFYYCMQYQ